MKDGWKLLKYATKNLTFRDALDTSNPLRPSVGIETSYDHRYKQLAVRVINFCGYLMHRRNS